MALLASSTLRYRAALSFLSASLSACRAFTCCREISCLLKSAAAVDIFLLGTVGMIMKFTTFHRSTGQNRNSQIFCGACCVYVCWLVGGCGEYKKR